MRRRTRNFILAVLAVLGLLLALGAVPGLLKSGDPYHMTATPVGEWEGPNATVGDDATPVNVTALEEQRYRFTYAAVGDADVSANATGRSDPYWRGPTGLKETFTHSPFDEIRALEEQNPRATAADGVYVHDNRTVYLLAVTQETQ